MRYPREKLKQAVCSLVSGESCCPQSQGPDHQALSLQIRIGRVQGRVLLGLAKQHPLCPLETFAGFRGNDFPHSPYRFVFQQQCPKRCVHDMPGQAGCRLQGLLELSSGSVSLNSRDVSLITMGSPSRPEDSAQMNADRVPGQPRGPTAPLGVLISCFLWRTF